MRIRREVWLVAALLAAATAPAWSESRDELFPELDAYKPFTDNLRGHLYSQATVVESTSGEKGPAPTGLTEAVYGAHLDITLTPRLRKRLREGDWQRDRFLWTRIGYEYSNSINGSKENKSYWQNALIWELTSHSQPLVGGLELEGRARWDLRDKNGENSSLYRLRLTIERRFDVRDRSITPYVRAEDIYNTKYDQWNQQRYQAGAELELSSRWRIDPYFEWRHDSRAQPERVNAFGLEVKYFAP
jgi:hypothetical protein